MSAKPNKFGQPGYKAGDNSTLLPLALALAVMISALFVVQIKHRHRTLTTEVEKLRTERERLELEWAQLQLEEATLAQHSRVDMLARTQFDMIDPRDYKIVNAGGSAAALPASALPLEPDAAGIVKP